MSQENVFLPHLIGDKQAFTGENAALFQAAVKGDEAQVVSLLKDPKVSADLFLHPEEQKNSLHVAAEKGHLKIVEALLSPRSNGQSGAFVDAIAATSQATPLVLAAQNGKADVCDLLLTKGANPNHGNGYGNTALHEAALNKLLPLAKLLISKGASVSLQNKKGSTALHFCCYDSPKNVNSSAAPSSSSSSSSSSGGSSSGTGDKPDSKAALAIAEALIDAGADVNGRDKAGMTPYLACCMSGRIDLLHFLREKGADITAVDISGRSAFDIATFNNHTNIAAISDSSSPAQRFKL